MCGRYNIIPDAEAWATVFKLSEDARQEIISLSPSYNVAPTQNVPIVRNNPETGEHELVSVHWGLIPFWAKDIKISYRMINARSETVAKKPAFQAAFRKRRCLIPANGFYEWRKDKAGKQPYLIRMQNKSPFAFAGLWESWRNSDEAVEMHSCTIITTQANDYMAQIHNRMPVILNASDYDGWLNPKPCPNEWLETYPVSTYVNSPRNNDSKCIEHLDVREFGLLSNELIFRMG